MFSDCSTLLGSVAIGLVLVDLSSVAADRRLFSLFLLHLVESLSFLSLTHQNVEQHLLKVLTTLPPPPIACLPFPTFPSSMDAKIPLLAPPPPRFPTRFQDREETQQEPAPHPAAPWPSDETCALGERSTGGVGSGGEVVWQLKTEREEHLDTLGELLVLPNASCEAALTS